MICIKSTKCPHDMKVSRPKNIFKLCLNCSHWNVDFQLGLGFMCKIFLSLFVMTVNETDHFSEVVEMRISTFTPELENKESADSRTGKEFQLCEGVHKWDETDRWTNEDVVAVRCGKEELFMAQSTFPHHELCVLTESSIEDTSASSEGFLDSAIDWMRISVIQLSCCSTSKGVSQGDSGLWIGWLLDPL